MVLNSSLMVMLMVSSLHASKIALNVKPDKFISTRFPDSFQIFQFFQLSNHISQHQARGSG